MLVPVVRANPDTVLPWGDLITSPGGSFTYLIQGAVCRLYDREELPYPSCSLQWKGKQPFWNRIGKRFVADFSTSRSPSYSVVLVGSNKAFTVTLGWVRLSSEQQQWWNGTRDRSKRKPVQKDIAA